MSRISALVLAALVAQPLISAPPPKEAPLMRAAWLQNDTNFEIEYWFRVDDGPWVFKTLQPGQRERYAYPEPNTSALQVRYRETPGVRTSEFRYGLLYGLSTKDPDAGAINSFQMMKDGRTLDVVHESR